MKTRTLSLLTLPLALAVGTLASASFALRGPGWMHGLVAIAEGVTACLLGWLLGRGSE